MILVTKQGVRFNTDDSNFADIIESIRNDDTWYVFNCDDRFVCISMDNIAYFETQDINKLNSQEDS